MKELMTVAVREGAVLWMSILYLTQILVATVISGSLAMFVQECFKQDMLFRRYYLWLEKMWDKLEGRPYLKAFLSPLGLCVYCNGTWIYLGVFALLYGINIGFILGIGLNFIFIHYLEKKYE